jgi:RimJ/RimL family protein N-acetyltransferase
MRHMTVRGTLSASRAEEAEVLVVGDGTRISLRQVRAEDRDRLAALFARLSPQSRYWRFLSPKRELTVTDLIYFTDVDHHNHEAVVAVDPRDDSIVGIARYVRDTAQAGVAEVAIEVADAFQRMGIGTALADLTMQYAHANGLRLLTATAPTMGEACRSRAAATPRISCPGKPQWRNRAPVQPRKLRPVSASGSHPRRTTNRHPNMETGRPERRARSPLVPTMRTQPLAATTIASIAALSQPPKARAASLKGRAHGRSPFTNSHGRDLPVKRYQRLPFSG